MSYSTMLVLLYLTMHLRCVFSDMSDERIINGTCTDIRNASYTLSFRINGEHKCGAAILTKDWAVTAAHCVQAANSIKEITVCSGMNKLNEPCNAHCVTNSIIHGNYSKETNDYDIALIKVNPPFIFNKCTKAVDIASGNQIYKKWATVCGWGYYLKFYWNAPILSECLRCITIPLVNKKICQEDYETYSVVTPRMTCYGYQEGGVDTCKGDSGGPLVNKDNKLIGITSWGRSCAEEHSPGVYTDTIILKDWIKEKIEIKT